VQFGCVGQSRQTVHFQELDTTSPGRRGSQFRSRDLGIFENAEAVEKIVANEIGNCSRYVIGDDCDCNLGNGNYLFG